MVSRPIPLAYLRLGSFNGATESRRIREEKGCLLDGLRSRTEILYPFTVYHASNKMNRRYTLYVGSEAVRRKWYAAFVDTLAVYRARAEGNMVSGVIWERTGSWDADEGLVLQPAEVVGGLL